MVVQMGIGVEAVSPEWREEEACSEDCSGLLDACEGSAMGAMLDSRAIQVQFQLASEACHQLNLFWLCNAVVNLALPRVVLYCTAFNGLPICLKVPSYWDSDT